MLQTLVRAHSNLFHYNYSYRSPYTVFLLFVLAVVCVAAPGCSTLPSPASASSTSLLVAKLTLQAAAIRQIREGTRTPEEAAARAAKIKHIAQAGKVWLDTNAVPLISLPTESRARIADAITQLPPEEQLLARQLVFVLETSLNALLEQQSPTLPAVPEHAKATVNTLLDWVIEAAEAYGV